MSETNEKLDWMERVYRRLIERFGVLEDRNGTPREVLDSLDETADMLESRIRELYWEMDEGPFRWRGIQ